MNLKISSILKTTSFSKNSNNNSNYKNKETIENITVSKYQFENDDIKIFKYEK